MVFAAKLALGLALLAYLLLREGSRERLGQILGGFRWEWIPALLGISVLLVGVSCLKWGLFLRHRRIQVSLPRLLGLYLIGIFFNNFLPSMFGGDVVRSYLLGRQISSQARSLASVFLERMTGMVALVTLAAIGIALRPALVGEPLVAVSAVAVLAAGAVTALSLRYPQLARRGLRPFSRWRVIRRSMALLDEFIAEMAEYRGASRTILLSFCYSYLFHILTGLNVIIAAGSLGLRLDVLATFALTPIILVVSSIPATPNGLGVWEWAFSFYLVHAGASPEAGLAIALILRAKGLLNSLIGGLLFLVEGVPARSLIGRRTR